MVKRNVFLLSFLVAGANAIHSANQDYKLIFISVPKTGTWLLNKAIKLISGRKSALARKNNKAHLPSRLMEPSLAVLDKATDLQNNEFLLTHLAYKPEYAKLLKDKNFKIIFMIRHPADQLVSRVFYTFKNPDRYAGLQHVPFEKLLDAYMGVGAQPNQKFDRLLKSHFRFNKKPKQLPISHIVQFYEQYLPWMNVPGVLTVRFENLVGPQGGGSKKAQLCELKKLAEFLGEQLTTKEINEIAGELFGGVATFRKGQIGQWKKHFTPQQKKGFHEIASKLVADLGYTEN